MAITIYIISGLFILLCVALIFGYRRTQHAGLLLMSLIYGVSAALALWKMHWWPLAAGFALVWVMRLLGMEPPMAKDEGGRMKDEAAPKSDGKDST
jgi:glucose dehydrogenase